ncbi:MAG: 30S ribosomal protein S27ae [Candidatus Bathyarchaeota archaeon]|nr:30S ribosomal protein S27ae [Candidatus Bathyarchaeota archaeon]
MSGERSREPSKEKPVSSYYEIRKGKVERLLPTCERCGPGYFMADHGDRYSCGHCGFTRYKVEDQQEG